MIDNKNYKDTYSFLMNLFLSSKNENTKLALARIIGETTLKNYCGTFREPAIESFFEKYSVKRFGKIGISERNNTDNEIVHILSTCYTTGGHTRLVENIVQLDAKRRHHLILTEQGSVPLRESLIDLIRSGGGEILIINTEEELSTRCNQIQQFVFQHDGKIMIHIHPYDFLPSIALSAFKDKLEILFFNHADHVFSYGCDIAHKVINIRDEAHNCTVHFRKKDQSYVLPLPIIKKEVTKAEQQEIKKKYGINEDTIIGLSIGSSYKFIKTETHHFFRTIYQALQSHPTLHIFIVGVDEASVKNSMYEYIYHNRLHLMGIMDDPTDLQSIADLAIDPMPFGSYTSLLETSYYGAYPLVCYNTFPLFNLYQDPSFDELIKLDKNEQEYLNHLTQFFSGKVQLDRNSIKERIEQYHSGNYWLIKYENIISSNFPSENSNCPDYMERLYQLNEEYSIIKNRILSFLYENIQLFTKLQLVKISFYLMRNGYSKREIAGIFKKHFLQQ